MSAIEVAAAVVATCVASGLAAIVSGVIAGLVSAAAFRVEIAWLKESLHRIESNCAVACRAAASKS